MPFKDVLAAVMATEGAVFPENMEADLTAAFDEDFGVSAGAIEKLTADNGALNEMIAGLKVRLHDYMAAEAASAATGDAGSDDSTHEPDDEEADFDGFFTEDKDK